MVGKCQFSLASLFVATTFVALASMAARNFVLGTDPFDRLVAWFVLPIFVCGVIGALRNQLRAWLSFSASRRRRLGRRFGARGIHPGLMPPGHKTTKAGFDHESRPCIAFNRFKKIGVSIRRT